jgi:hypothetical protein
MAFSTQEVATRLRRALGFSEDYEDVIRTPSASVLRLGVLFATELLVLAALWLPNSMRFDWHAFADQGTNLRVQVLLDQGQRPMIDFGYLYGLLPLTVGRLWFWLADRTPVAYQAALIVCQLLVAWGLARFAVAARVRWAGLALLMVSMPFAVQSSYVNLAHALETVLLSHALAEQAGGRRTRALVLATICLFVKPAMAYVYGLILVLILAWRAFTLDRIGLKGLVRALAPAAATGVALAALLLAIYGPVSLALTVLPVAGARNYSALNFGFFRGAGRDFWRPSGAGLGYYLGTVAGFWIAGTVCLIAATLLGALRWSRETTKEQMGGTPEIIFTCAAMHVAFVCAFFGNAWSWSYYAYVLIMGLAVVPSLGALGSLTVWGLAALALLGQKVTVQSLYTMSRTTSRHADMADLWSSPQEQAEWIEVMQLLRGPGATLLGSQGGAIELFYPQTFAPPVDFFLNPGLALPVEVRRKVEQIATAPQILMFHGLEKADHFLSQWPEFRAALDGCEVAHDGESFRVYRRISPPSRHKGP